MILVGLENCESCKIAHQLLPDVKYIVLQRGIKNASSEEIINIKRALGKKNITGKFPVIFSDDLTEMIETDDVLNNLSKQKIINKFGIK